MALYGAFRLQPVQHSKFTVYPRCMPSGIAIPAGRSCQHGFGFPHRADVGDIAQSPALDRVAATVADGRSHWLAAFFTRRLDGGAGKAEACNEIDGSRMDSAIKSKNRRGET
jgi:hypothetical protein